MGNYGFQVMLARALALAGEEVPWLRKIHMNNEGVFDQLNDPNELITADVLFQGSVVFIARLLELLIAFIGETLTLRLLRDVWPKVSRLDLNLNEGAKT